MAWSLDVSSGIPREWDGLVSGYPASASRRMMTLTIDRFGEGYRTFSLCDRDTVLVAIGGSVVESPLPSPRIDPYQIFSGRAAGLGLLADGPHPWSGLGSADVLPGLVFMHPTYETFPVGSAGRDPAVLRDFVQQLLNWAGDAGLSSIAFLYLADAARPLLDVLGEAGAQVLPLTSTCVMEVTWDDFADYLRTLPSHRRVMIRRELRRLDENAVTVGAEDPMDAAAAMAALRGRLVGKYGERPNASRDARLLDQILTSFRPDELCLITARRDGDLLSFMLFGQDGDHWTALLTGADYDEPRSRFTYFACAFYHPAILAPRHGVRCISYGIGSWEAKRLRGCRLRPVFAAELQFAGVR